MFFVLWSLMDSKGLLMLFRFARLDKMTLLTEVSCTAVMHGISEQTEKYSLDMMVVVITCQSNSLLFFSGRLEI